MAKVPNAVEILPKF